MFFGKRCITYLIDTFQFNDWANRRILEAMRKMPDDRESVNLFSHLIRAQNKWMRRIERDPAETEIKWFVYPEERILTRRMLVPVECE